MPLRITDLFTFRRLWRLGYEKPQSAYGLCAVFLRHILARRNAAHCGGPKCRKQPERYATLGLKCVGNFTKYNTKQLTL
jgi:hypothetical protein